MHDELLFNATACQLAVALHHARITVWPDRESRPWEQLPSREQHLLVEHAADVLEAVKPLPRLNVLDLPAYLLKVGADGMRGNR